MKNRFGGLWTREKLNILEKYLAFYTTAMKNQPFTLHYVDAFAGTGKQDRRVSDMQEDFLPEEGFNGSVRIALDSQPGFDRYHFNDLNSDHAAVIKRIAECEYPAKLVSVSEMDANKFIPAFCAGLNNNDRAVILLDPFSTQLNWEAVICVAQTWKIDLWLLFPISVILRMTPREGVKIKPEWRETLNRLLGTSDWETALYHAKEKPPID
jgi:three-Cys-motif partner protein